MKPTVTASRAILAAYARKILLPIEIIALILFTAAMFGTTYLITAVSAWWWLLMILVVLYGIIGSVIWLIVHIALNQIEPVQTEVQRKAVGEFILQTEAVADMLGLSRFGLLLRILRDVVRKRKDNVIVEFAKDSQQLKKRLAAVIETFRS